MMFKSNKYVIGRELGPVGFFWFRPGMTGLRLRLRRDRDHVDSSDWRVWRMFEFWRLWVGFRTSRTYSPHQEATT